MMVGIDVTHPGPMSREGTPSIAAVVASVDSSFVQFPASLRIQETKKEVSSFLSPCHTNTNALHRCSMNYPRC